MNYKKTIIFIFIAVTLLICSISIGYSAFNTEFFVSGATARVLPEANIRVTNVTTASTQSSAKVNSLDHSSFKILSDISLPNETSSVTYQVTVKNLGNVPMGIDAINVNSENSGALEVVVEDGILKNMLQNGGSTLGISKTFNVTVKYKSGAYQTSAHTFNNLVLDFVYKPAYTVSYVNISGTNLPTSVLEGNTLTVNFGSSAPTISSVKMGGVETQGYTYTGGNFALANVTGNVIINSVNFEDMDLPITDGVTEISAPGISSGTPMNIANFKNLVLEGGNATSVVITGLDVILTYKTTSGSSQSIDVILTTGGQTYTQSVSFRGKQTNATATASFTGLSIGMYDTFTITNNNYSGNNKVDISGEKIRITYAN